MLSNSLRKKKEAGVLEKSAGAIRCGATGKMCVWFFLWSEKSLVIILNEGVYNPGVRVTVVRVIVVMEVSVSSHQFLQSLLLNSSDIAANTQIPALFQWDSIT